MLALVKVPEHGDAVLASGRAKRAIGRDGDGRDVAGVAEVVRAELALGELPDLVIGERRAGQRVVRTTLEVVDAQPRVGRRGGSAILVDK